MPVENKPFLVLGRPRIIERSDLPRDMRSLHTPPIQRQRARLGTKFSDLRRVLSNQNNQLAQEVAGLEPEKVIVFEMVSSSKVDDFYKALKSIDGLQWLSEFDGAEVDDDNDFYYTNFDDDERLGRLKRRLYLVMADQQGIRVILRYWREYLRGDEGSFPRGQTKWKHLFSLLHDVRTWNATDRTFATGLEEDWQARVEAGAERVKIEIELWYRTDEEKRNASSEAVRALITSAEGVTLRESVIPEIKYHAILAELPIGAVEGIVSGTEEIQIARADAIMFFRPSGQAVVRTTEGTDALVCPDLDLEIIDETIHIGVLDGLPIENHSALLGRIEVDDVFGWSAITPVDQRKHGTAMASLIAHCDLSNHAQSLKTRLYIRPVLIPLEDRSESIPLDQLVVDLVHASLRRIFEGTAEVPALHPSMKIINFSIGEKYRPFVSEMSPLARLLDWYAYKYRVLFLVSAGNYPSDIRFSAPSAAVEQMADDVRQHEAVANWTKEATTNRILSPSESINSLCIGASNNDDSTVEAIPGRIALLQNTDLPCLYNPVGLGFRSAIKPDLFTPGGRVLYRMTASDRTGSTFRIVDTPTHSPGQKVAYPSPNPGQTNRAAFLSGTSNSTAYATHHAGKLIEQFIEEQLAETPPEDYWSVLVKALLVHSTDWREAKDLLKAAAPADVREDSNKLKSWLTRFLGHGIVDKTRLFSCDDHRATAIGYGSIGADEAHEFSFPLPESLSNAQTLRRLTVTLAWFSPVEVQNKKYRGAQLWFEQRGSIAQNPLQVSRARYDWRTVKRGTVQHEIFEGETLAPFSREDGIKIKVNCKRETGSRFPPIHYGLAVTAEDADRSIQTIYQEIRARIPAARVRA